MKTEDGITKVDLKLDESNTTDSIVQILLARGLTMDQIVMPGTAKGIVIYIADDFDAPLEDFEDHS